MWFSLFDLIHSVWQTQTWLQILPASSPQWGSSFKELKSGENVLISGKILSMDTFFKNERQHLDFGKQMCTNVLLWPFKKLIFILFKW